MQISTFLKGRQYNAVKCVQHKSEILRGKEHWRDCATKGGTASVKNARSSPDALTGDSLATLSVTNERIAKATDIHIHIISLFSSQTPRYKIIDTHK